MINQRSQKKSCPSQMSFNKKNSHNKYNCLKKKSKHMKNPLRSSQYPMLFKSLIWSGWRVSQASSQSYHLLKNPICQASTISKVFLKCASL